jgi:hypothetical protein
VSGSPQVEAIVGARHDDPLFLPWDASRRGGICARAMLPQAEKMAVGASATGDIAAEGVRIHPDGPFVATLAGRREPFRYRLRVLNGDIESKFQDVYRFSPLLGELDMHLLVEGNHLASYHKLGAHPILHEGAEGVAFARCGRQTRVGSALSWTQCLGRAADERTGLRRNDRRYFSGRGIDCLGDGVTPGLHPRPRLRL